MCCVHCSSDQPSDSTHSRVGRKMNQFCSVCQVYICDNCWEQFHNSPVLDLPPCVSGKYNLAVQTRSNVSRCIPCPDASSPVRVSRPRGNASRPRNTSRPRNISNDRRGQPSSSAMSTLRGSPIRRQCSCCTAATECNENRQITATSGANKKKSQKKMKEMIHTSAVTIARTTINISSL